MSDTRTGHYISGAAALIVLLFFFLPWASVSCAGQSITQVSGMNLASGNILMDGDTKLYLVPLIGIIVIGLVVAATRYAITEEASAGGQIFAALVGFLVLWLKWDEIGGAAEGFDLISALTNEISGTRAGEAFSFNLDYGMYGTVVGLLLVLVGAVATYLATRASPEYEMEESYSDRTISDPSTPFGDSSQQTESYFGDSEVSPGGTPGVTSAMGASSAGEGGYDRPSPETELLRKEPESLAWLVITDGPRTGHQFRLFENNGIGRDADNEVVLDDTSLSGRHARIRMEEGTFYLYDLASTNGTFMFDKQTGDWKQVYREPLDDGDRLKFGRTILQLMAVDTGNDES